MEALLTNYTLSEMLLFLIAFALAFKGLVTFFDWLRDRLHIAVKRGQRPELLQQQINEQNKNYELLRSNQQIFDERFKELENRIQILIESDKDDIKSFITDKHHFYCYQNQQIDDYTLDCIEKRYEHYLKEGGNSFIGDLMKELRRLPKRPYRNNSNKE